MGVCRKRGAGNGCGSRPNPSVVAASTQKLAAADAAAGTGGLEEVLVTAEKRTEDIKDVPISITAIGGDQLQAVHIIDYDDVSRAVLV